MLATLPRLHQVVRVVLHIVGLEKDARGQIGVRMSNIAELVDVSRRHLPAIRKVIRRL